MIIYQPKTLFQNPLGIKQVSLYISSLTHTYSIVLVSLTEAGRKSAAKRPEYWTFKRWQDVKVGDFILLRNDEFIPADIIIFSTSEEDSACYVETKNLDGETNLKVRHGIPFLTHIKTPEQCSHIKGYVDTEYPTSNMYNYTGTAHLSVVNGKTQN